MRLPVFRPACLPAPCRFGQAVFNLPGPIAPWQFCRAALLEGLEVVVALLLPGPARPVPAVVPLPRQQSAPAPPETISILGLRCLSAQPGRRWHCQPCLIICNSAQQIASSTGKPTMASNVAMIRPALRLNQFMAGCKALQNSLAEPRQYQSGHGAERPPCACHWRFCRPVQVCTGGRQDAYSSRTRQRLRASPLACARQSQLWAYAFAW